MKLYYSPGVCSLSPHIAARELEIPIELVRVDMYSRTLADGGDYLALNPLGYVPMLELGNGERMLEGTAIVQYLADLKPEKGLAPPNGTMARYRLQSWLAFINSELHKAFGVLFDPAAPSDTKSAARKKIGQRFDWLSEQLAGKTFLMGEQFTVADGYLFTVLNWSAFVGLDRSQWPVLDAYHGRIAQRPSVQAALQAEGLLKKTRDAGG